MTERLPPIAKAARCIKATFFLLGRGIARAARDKVRNQLLLERTSLLTDLYDGSIRFATMPPVVETKNPVSPGAKRVEDGSI